MLLKYSLVCVIVVDSYQTHLIKFYVVVSLFIKLAVISYMIKVTIVAVKGKLDEVNLNMVLYVTKHYIIVIRFTL